MYEYRATIERVKDGDTFACRVDYGFRQGGDWSIRVRNLWSPELATLGGPEAKAYALLLLPPGGRVVIRTLLTRTGTETTSLERYVADVTLPDGRDFAATMIAAGHGTALP